MGGGVVWWVWPVGVVIRMVVVPWGRVMGWWVQPGVCLV
jgi:hypothetical protein